MVVAFSAMVYIDYKDDGEVFNGSVTPQEYIGATALGALLGLIAGLEFTITIPMLGFVNGGSAMSIGIVGTTAVSINGAQVIAGAAMAGAAYMFSRPNSGRIRFSDEDIGIDPETGKEATQKRAYKIYRNLTEKVKKMKWKKRLKGKWWMKTHFGK